jgi:hypothetical protein
MLCFSNFTQNNQKNQTNTSYGNSTCKLCFSRRISSNTLSSLSSLVIPSSNNDQSSVYIVVNNNKHQNNKQQTTFTIFLNGDNPSKCNEVSQVPTACRASTPDVRVRFCASGVQKRLKKAIMCCSDDAVAISSEVF